MTYVEYSALVKKRPKKKENEFQNQKKQGG
jgi:hypothetical protein